MRNDLLDPEFGGRLVDDPPENDIGPILGGALDAAFISPGCGHFKCQPLDLAINDNVQRPCPAILPGVKLNAVSSTPPISIVPHRRKPGAPPERGDVTFLERQFVPKLVGRIRMFTKPR